MDTIRRTLGQEAGFALRRTAPATRGDQPLSVTRLQRRSIGNLSELENMRNAVEHAHERLRRGAVGNTMLVPRAHGVSFDDHGLSYTEIAELVASLLSLAHDLLDAGSDHPPSR